MTTNTRARMVQGAADLMSRRGINATTMREVVRHTGTPRGSIGYYFPRGKEQLLEEAIEFAGAQVSGPLRHLVAKNGAVAGLRAFVDLWRQTLEKSNFTAGCPILAIAVEPFVNDDKETNSTRNDVAEQHLLDLAHDVLADWQGILSAALRTEGVSSAKARRLAALVIASVEGTVAMCRAARNAKPLDDVLIELELLLKNVIASD